MTILVSHQAALVVCEGQVMRFYEARFSETESLWVQYKLVRIHSTVVYNSPLGWGTGGGTFFKVRDTSARQKTI